MTCSLHMNVSLLFCLPSFIHLLLCHPVRPVAHFHMHVYSNFNNFGIPIETIMRRIAIMPVGNLPFCESLHFAANGFQIAVVAAFHCWRIFRNAQILKHHNCSRSVETISFCGCMWPGMVCLTNGAALCGNCRFVCVNRKCARLATKTVIINDLIFHLTFRSKR